MSGTDREIAELIVDHLVAIHGGTCTITDEMIEAEQDENLATVLAGLMILHESLRHRQLKMHAAVEELRRAKEAAESAASAKSDFLASVSHEVVHDEDRDLSVRPGHRRSPSRRPPWCARP